MPLDTPTTDTTRARIEEAARWLYRSMETESSMLRAEFCLKAGQALRFAAALATGEQHFTIAAHCRQAETLAGQFYGDGMGVSRLFDELRALTGRRR